MDVVVEIVIRLQDGGDPGPAGNTQRRAIIATPPSLKTLFIAGLRHKDIAATILATMRAGMMCQPGPAAARAGDQLRQLQVMMRTPFALTSMRDPLFW